MLVKQFNIVGGLLISLSFLLASCGTTARSPEPTVHAQATTQAIESPSPVSTVQATPKTEQTARRKTVADYFLEIPEQYFQPIRLSTQQRQELLSAAEQGQGGNIYDPNNGYLQVTSGGDSCPTVTIAIFSRPSASPLVAVSLTCTSGDTTKILDPDQNWRDVTATVLPVDLSPSSNASYIVEVKLPQIGRTIEVSHLDENNQRTLIGRYQFDGERFVEE
ncbi:hypothetical protein H6F67_19960 [Microcoleus sp. FACHB-1515]|uniref:hypothetical protein n=1 Tax=Cyanophyceae TaxID=3028117 RepID=UPI0016865BDF|nr:hypothetical protein [Microcoleus sp. FACHB-1515]MBD2092128.1 hypothetical protein [Microcoleus sp. FACHB-1515]